ncbi:MAG: putative toxin-antitoxin system toxin component, PIN family [Chloroflexi bacterium]|nr:MAG: putative toxin-antitoxin system toxin component, PIN family [Chloroflexota bacterium]
MRVVLDTNVLIAAFITQGVCSDLLEHCLRHHTLIVSEFILAEFRRHLVRKFKYSPGEVNEALELLMLKVKMAVPAELENPVCRDPDDDFILGTALAGSAACIVTGDKDLLSLKKYKEIDIISPAQFGEYEARRQR